MKLKKSNLKPKYQPISSICDLYDDDQSIGAISVDVDNKVWHNITREVELINFITDVRIEVNFFIYEIKKKAYSRN